MPRRDHSRALHASPGAKGAVPGPRSVREPLLLSGRRGSTANKYTVVCKSCGTVRQAAGGGLRAGGQRCVRWWMLAMDSLQPHRCRGRILLPARAMAHGTTLGTLGPRVTKCLSQCWMHRVLIHQSGIRSISAEIPASGYEMASTRRRSQTPLISQHTPSHCMQHGMDCPASHHRVRASTHAPPDRRPEWNGSAVTRCYIVGVAAPKINCSSLVLAWGEKKNRRVLEQHGNRPREKLEPSR